MSARRLIAALMLAGGIILERQGQLHISVTHAIFAAAFLIVIAMPDGRR